EAPCVQRSAWNTILERGAANDRASTAGANGSTVADRVRVGLGRVFGLHESTAARIVAARADGPFASLADLADRVRASLPELESLIDAGALDGFGRTRTSLRLEARVLASGNAGRATSGRGAAPVGARVRAAAHRAPVLIGGGDAFLPPPVAPIATPELPEFADAERVRRECAATGLWFSGHPLDVLAPDGAARATVPAATLEAHTWRDVAI